MLKCKNECPNEQVEFNGCCAACSDWDSCEDACVKDPVNCGDSIMVEGDEETALVVFENTQAIVLQNISTLITVKKELEAQEAELKIQIQAAMEAYGIKKFESEILNISYIEATTAESVDSAKLKKKFPDIAAQCMKKADRKAYVKVTLK